MTNEEVKEEIKGEETTPEVKEESPKRETRREEFDDEFIDKKTRKELNGKSVFSRVINVVLWVVLIAWMGVCIWDFVNVKTDKDPMFCITKKTTKYDDGEVDTCLGAGYKVFNYKRTSFTGREFGPFWKKDRTENNK